MGFLDKVKDTATKGAEKAKQAVDTGQEKLGDAKLKKKIESYKQEIGGLVYAQRTGSAGTDTDAEIDRLVAEIQAAEEELAASE
jgi:hypothetical protein